MAQIILNQQIKFLNEYKGDNDIKYSLLPQAYFRLGSINQKNEKIEDSINDFQKCVEILEEYGKSNDNLKIDLIQLLATSYQKLGKLNQQQKKAQEAINFYQSALLIGKQIQPMKNIFNLKVATSLADLYRKQQNYNEAISLLQEILPELNLEDKRHTPIYSIAITTLIISYMKNGQNLDELSQMLDSIEQEFIKHQKMFDPFNFAQFYDLRSVLAVEMQQDQDAINFLQKSLTISKKILPEGHQFIQQISQRIQELQTNEANIRKE